MPVPTTPTNTSYRAIGQRGKTKRDTLKRIIAEFRSRGLEVPTEMLEQMKGILPTYMFKKSPNGYYMGMDNRIFNPNEKQIHVIDSTARYVACLAGRGSGKSAVGVQKALRKLEQGWCGVVGNPDFENLKISTWPEFARWCDYQMVVPKQRHRLQPDWQPNQPFKLNFNNGAWAIFKGIKDPDSARGPNINWFWYDEPGRGDPMGQDWQIANASVRVGKDPQTWATGTPVGKDHWLYRFFIQQDIPQEAIDEFRKASPDRDLIDVVFTNIEDNKANLDPGYYASMLAAYPEGWLRRQELYGEFVDQGGVLGNREWFDGMIVPAPPEEYSGRIRFWDLAASERKIVAGKKINDPDETVGTLMSWLKSGPEYYIEDQVAGCWAWDDLKREIMTTAWKDGSMVRQVFEEEPGSGGKNQVAELTQLLLTACPGYPMAMGWRPEGDKVMRANVWFAEAAQKKIYLVSGEWNGKFLDQLSSFPIARHDDRIDSVSGARFNLAPIRTWRQTKFLHL